MLKILMLSNMYPSKKDNYGVFVKNFYETLSYDKTIICSKIVIKGRSYNNYEKLFKYISYYFKITYTLLFHKYDMVYVHNLTHTTPILLTISFLKKIKYIFHIHGEDLLIQTRLEKYLLNMATPMMYSANCIVVPSYFFKGQVLLKFPQLDAEKIFVSPSGGINTSLFKPMTIERKNTFTVGYISRIDRGKGWDVFLDAISILVSRIDNIEGFVVGDGVQVSSCIQKLESLGLQHVVTYNGRKRQDVLPSFYNQMDLFIFPTLLPESLGLVGLEAMACGIPVIGTRIGGLTDYLNEACNGFFFEQGNHIDLADKILKYYNMSQKEKTEMNKNAIETAMKYDSKITSAKLLNHLKNL